MVKIIQEEISLEQLLEFIFRNILYFILSAALCAGVAFIYADNYIEPSFESRAELLVNQGKEYAEPIEISQIDTSIRLINTYRNIIVSDSTLSMVSE